MQYTSTRNNALRVSSAHAILKGLAPDGGLFVPVEIPKLDFAAMIDMPYEAVAHAVLSAFLPDFDSDFLRGAINASYGANFGGKAGYVAKVDEGLYSLELWHGPTAAFKDYALQLMPRLLAEARRMLGEQDETLILVATSGDTGSAALAGYSGLPGIKLAVFYPQNGVSAIQYLQMATQAGENVHVYAIQGNFDDAQRGVKRAFTDAALAQKLEGKGVRLSSANSINWGRLVPQVVYYVTAYLQLCRAGATSYGQPVNFCVPTGNFGDIMAGWYAKQMGLPVGRLICAANQNNVLADFMETGVYDANRSFYKTSSPSMDILVSSNLERILWHSSGSDAAVAQWMGELAAKGRYQVPPAAMDRIRDTFTAGWATEDAVMGRIGEILTRYRYLCDPHTAVAFEVLARQAEAGGVPAVVLSTASPFKFCGDVLRALKQPEKEDPFEAVAALEKATGAVAPASIKALERKAIRFTDIIDPDTIVDVPLQL